MTAGPRRRTLALAVTVMAIVLARAVSAAPGGAEEAFVTGNGFYEEGDFVSAVASYEKVLELGVTSAELEYNLGNAYLKAGRVGPAILHYRRALEMDPSYETALNNIVYARSLTQDMKNDPAPPSALAWIGKFRLGPSTAAALLFVAFCLFVTVAGLRLRLWPRSPWATVVQGILGGLVLLLGGATLFEWNELEGAEDGVVMASEVDVRAGPGDTYTVSFRLHEGTEVELLRENSGWQEVKVSDSLQGWVPEKDVSEI